MWLHSEHFIWSTMTTQQFQHGPSQDFLTAVSRMHNVAAKMPLSAGNIGLTVEVVLVDPYSVTVGAVTAVGFKDDAVLLTVEPVNQPTKEERLAELVRILSDIGVRDGATPVAKALLERGVLPIRLP